MASGARSWMPSTAAVTRSPMRRPWRRAGRCRRRSSGRGRASPSGSLARQLGAGADEGLEQLLVVAAHPHRHQRGVGGSSAPNCGGIAAPNAVCTPTRLSVLAPEQLTSVRLGAELGGEQGRVVAVRARAAGGQVGLRHAGRGGVGVPERDVRREVGERLGLVGSAGVRVPAAGQPGERDSPPTRRAAVVRRISTPTTVRAGPQRPSAASTSAATAACPRGRGWYGARWSGEPVAPRATPRRPRRRRGPRWRRTRRRTSRRRPGASASASESAASTSRASAGSTVRLRAGARSGAIRG